MHYNSSSVGQRHSKYLYLWILYGMKTEQQVLLYDSDGDREQRVILEKETPPVVTLQLVADSLQFPQ